LFASPPTVFYKITTISKPNKFIFYLLAYANNSCLLRKKRHRVIKTPSIVVELTKMNHAIKNMCCCNGVLLTELKGGKPSHAPQHEEKIVYTIFGGIVPNELPNQNFYFQ